MPLSTTCRRRKCQFTADLTYIRAPAVARKIVYSFSSILIMEYIPPSDPEEDSDDYDAEHFFCIAPNSAKPVISFSQLELQKDTEYATLRPVHLGNTSPGK